MVVATLDDTRNDLCETKGKKSGVKDGERQRGEGLWKRRKDGASYEIFEEGVPRPT